MASETHHATDAEAVNREHWWNLFEEFNISSFPSATMRGFGFIDNGHELRICK